MNFVKNFQTILNIFFTPQCLLCQSIIDTPALCFSCQSLALTFPIHEFNVVDSAKGALYYYEFSIRDIIKGAKFYQNKAYIHALYTLIHQRIQQPEIQNALKRYAPTVLCPVPTPFLKQVVRGVDIPTLFAHILGKHLNIPVQHLLRARYNKPSLSRITSKSERKKAIVGSFSLKKFDVVYERLLLVDDIFTTGSTFDESCKILKPVARTIRCLAIGRTP